MKKLFTAAVLVLGMVFAQQSFGQTKIGYISVDQMVGNMPEIGKLDSLLERYQADSINPEYTALVQRYQFDDSLYRDSVKTPKAVRDEIAKKLPGYIYQIQNWQSITNQLLESKQNEFLSPIYNKVYAAIRQVAKEKNYTHVFNKEAFLVAPEGDDLILLVAQKLKVSITPTNPKPKPGN